MAAPAKSFHEPVESNDPRNVVLDLVEMSIRQALALDPALEHPLRARLTRLLPEPPKPAPEPSGDLWEASVVLTALVE